MTHELQARAATEYQSLLPKSRLGRSLDTAIARWLPRVAMRQEMGRRSMAMFRAQGAYPNSGRGNAFPGHTGETFQTNRERRQLMWNALDLIDNSGLGESITGKFGLYTTGTLRYQARTGDKHINAAYEAIMAERTGPGLDVTGRHSLRQMAVLDIRGCVVKGGIVHDWVRPDADDPLIYLQSIEYDRLGNPYDYTLSQQYVGGITLDGLGREATFDIFARDRMGGNYWFQERLEKYDEWGRQQVLHLFNPKTHDQYKGETAFKTVIDLVHYCDQMRKFELEAMQWAATQTAIYYTGTGEMPQRPFEDRVDPAGRQTRIVRVGGPELSSMEIGEDVKMFESQRPSPNVIAMWLNCVKEICIATGLPMTFVYGMDANGPGVRFDGAQADRAIGGWWSMLEERLLKPAAEVILSNAIANGDAPYHPLWKKGRWIGPAKLSIDAGYDSAAMLNENKEGIRSASSILLDRAEDEDEERAQIGIEADAWIKLAKQVAADNGIDNWQLVLPMLRQSSGASAGIAPTLPSPVTTPPPDPNKGASTDGVSVQ